MYATHQKTISECGLATVRGFERVGWFALATIRCGLPAAARATVEYDTTGNRNGMAFFGTKHLGLDWIELHARDLREEVIYLNASLSGQALDVALVDAIERIPGIGLAKAGFIAQMLFGRVGCLDTHNLIRFGFDERMFRSLQGIKNPARRTAKICRYVDTCADQGNAQELWDSWCTYVADRSNYGSAEEISALHLAAAGPEYYRNRHSTRSRAAVDATRSS